MKHGLTRKFVGAFSLVVLLSVLILNFFVGLKLKNYFEVKTTERLRSNAILIGDILRDDIVARNREAIQEKTAELARRLEVRITIIGSDGRVLADTTQDPGEMDDHSGRLEMERAMQGGTGQSTRYSDTLHYNMKYVAVAVESGGLVKGFVRLALSLEDLEEQIQVIYRTVLIGGLVAFVCVLVIGGIIASSIIAPITEMTEVAQAISRGDFSKKLKVKSTDELGVLAQSMNSMADELRQTIDDLRRMDKVRTDFVANVSHELKTPLTSIRGFIETLEDGALEDKENARRFLAIIKKHANALANITDDLLRLSELESIEARVEKSPFDLRALVEEVASGFTQAMKEKDQEFVKSFKGDDFTVEADRQRIEQVMVNLVDNAINYSPAGSRIRVAVELADGEFKISVEDNGPGIPREHLPRVFERFYSVDKARSREVGGTGLGLSIVKHTVLMHKGEISMDSKLGRGTSVSFTLPRA